MAVNVLCLSLAVPLCVVAFPRHTHLTFYSMSITGFHNHLPVCSFYFFEPVHEICFVFLFDLILYVPSTIFQLNRDGSSWVEQVLS